MELHQIEKEPAFITRTDARRQLSEGFARGSERQPNGMFGESVSTLGKAVRCFYRL